MYQNTPQSHLVKKGVEGIFGINLEHPPSVDPYGHRRLLKAKKTHFCKSVITIGERKCHDFLPSFSPRRPFGVQNGLDDLLPSFF